MQKNIKKAVLLLTKIPTWEGYNLFEHKNRIDDKCLELGIYKNCKFDDYSNYIVRYKEELDYLDSPYYVVKSIKEENEA